MPEDIEDHIAVAFHGLVSDLQRSDVEKFEKEQLDQREKRALLRRSDPLQGMSAGELLKKMDGDPGDAVRAVQGDLDRIDREAKDAVDKVRQRAAPLPDGSFPPPPESE